MKAEKKEEKKIDEIQKRYEFSFSASRIGRFHALRVFLLTLGAMGLAWYANTGAERFRKPTTITVSAVRDSVAGVVAASVITEPPLAVWHDADLFGDGRLGAKRMMFAGVSVVVLDTVADVDFAAMENLRTSYREKIDLMIVQSGGWVAGEADVFFLRDVFRPKHIALVPPCVMQSTQNIICNNDVDVYVFDVRRRTIRLLED